MLLRPNEARAANAEASSQRFRNHILQAKEISSLIGLRHSPNVLSASLERSRSRRSPTSTSESQSQNCGANKGDSGPVAIKTAQCVLSDRSAGCNDSTRRSATVTRKVTAKGSTVTRWQTRDGSRQGGSWDRLLLGSARFSEAEADGKNHHAGPVEPFGTRKRLHAGQFGGVAASPFKQIDEIVVSCFQISGLDSLGCLPGNCPKLPGSRPEPSGSRLYPSGSRPGLSGDRPRLPGGCLRLPEQCPGPSSDCPEFCSGAPMA